MSMDRFGNDPYATHLDTTQTNPRDGYYITAQASRFVQEWYGALDKPAHVCSRVCPKHGDLAVWYDVALSEYVP